LLSLAATESLIPTPSSGIVALLWA